MPEPTIGPFAEDLKTLDETAVPLYMLQFDRDGALTSPHTLAHLVDRLAAGEFSDVLFVSHGWNNTFDDARGLYDDLFVGVESLRKRKQIALADYRPVLVGVHWPSISLLFPGERGPTIAGGDDGIAAFAAETADPERAAALFRRTAATPEERQELAELVAPVVDMPVAELLDLWAGGAATPPQPVRHGTSDWGEPDTGPDVAGSYFDPRWAHRVATVFQMKDRSRVVGARGVAQALRAIAAPGKARVHLAGHSFGCQVMLAALSAEGAPTVESVLLMQPAVNVYALAATVPGRDVPGGYRAALTRSRQPIAATYTTRDKALHMLFHRGVRRRGDLGELAPLPAGAFPKFGAIGGYGPQGLADGEVASLVLDGSLPPLPEGDHRLVALEGTAVIDGHSDLSTDTIYWLLLQHLMGAR